MQHLNHSLFIFLFSMILGTNIVLAQDGCTTGDCKNGKGRYIYSNGDKYIGEFKNGLPDGRGVYHYKNGDIYNGLWLKSKRHGYGTFKWANGDTYIGEYENHKKNGEGTYVFANGTEQKGIWKEGKLKRKLKEKTTTIVTVDNTDSNDPFKEKTPPNKKYVGQYFKALANIDQEQKRTALIIGNSAYAQAPLKNPVNDAIAVAEELQRSGFDAYVYTDLDQKTTKKAIREFGQKLKERGGVGLFYYAGHGLQCEGHNYLVPVNADIKKAQDIEFESVDLGRVLVELEYAENDMNILILDACRDNPYKEEFEKSKYSSYNGLAAVGSAPYNTFIAFSTAPGFAALDGEGTNGLYTQELLKALGTKSLGLEDVFKQVRKNVRKSSKGQQIPWESSSVEDDFYFKNSNNTGSK